MHLARQADAGDVARAKAGVGESFTNRNGASPPPVFRVLFGPSDLRRSEGRVFLGRGREQAALFVDDEGARAAGAYVNA